MATASTEAFKKKRKKAQMEKQQVSDMIQSSKTVASNVRSNCLQNVTVA